MVGRMVAHDVPFVDHALYKMGIGLTVVQGYEEDSLDVLFFQSVQDGSG